MNDSITFVAKLQELPQTFSWIQTKVRPTSLTLREKKQVELALEEAIVNIIEHAAKNAEISITITCRHEPFRHIEFAISDNGPPFNPLTAPEPDRTAIPLEEQKIGGVGISLMRKCMDSVFYRRENYENILTLVKNIY